MFTTSFMGRSSWLYMVIMEVNGPWFPSRRTMKWLYRVSSNFKQPIFKSSSTSTYISTCERPAPRCSACLLMLVTPSHDPWIQQQRWYNLQFSDVFSVSTSINWNGPIKYHNVSTSSGDTICSLMCNDLGPTNLLDTTCTGSCLVILKNMPTETRGFSYRPPSEAGNLQVFGENDLPPVIIHWIMIIPNILSSTIPYDDQRTMSSIENSGISQLVGGLEHVLFSHILGIIIPID